MKLRSRRQSLFRAVLKAAALAFAAAIFTFTAAAQPPAQAHYQHNLKRGPAPGGVEQTTFFIHRLGTDHAEGITTLDMNDDGRPDIERCLLVGESGSSTAGKWTAHQNREGGVMNEFGSGLAASGQST